MAPKLQLRDSVLRISTFKFSLLTSLSYCFDWVFFGVLLFLGMWWRRGDPRYQEFSLLDDDISHTYYNDLAVFVSDLTLFAVFLASPILLTFICFGFDPKDKIVRKLWNIYCGLLAFLAAQAIQTLIVTILKMQTGVPRPDMLQRCQPRSWNLSPLGSLSNVSICGNPNIRLIRDGFKSFPSGHATTSFASATYLFCIFASKFRLFRVRALTIKWIIATIPLLVALLLTASRYSDNRHSLFDLSTGSSIGSQCGYWCYRLYFNMLSDTSNAGMAYPPRRLGADDPNKLVWKLDGDETYQYDDTAETLSPTLPTSTSHAATPMTLDSSQSSASSPHGEFSRAKQEELKSKSRASSRSASRRFEV